MKNKIIKNFSFYTITSLALIILVAMNDCQNEKCDINKIKIANQNIDHLNYNIVKEFICTNDSMCSNDIEFTEFFNETLFKILDKAPEIFFDVLEHESFDHDLILKNIENPVIETDLISIYKKILSLKIEKSTKSKILNSIQIVAERSGQ